MTGQTVVCLSRIAHYRNFRILITHHITCDTEDIHHLQFLVEVVLVRDEYHGRYQQATNCHTFLCHLYRVTGNNLFLTYQCYGVVQGCKLLFRDKTHHLVALPPDAIAQTDGAVKDTGELVTFTQLTVKTGTGQCTSHRQMCAQSVGDVVVAGYAQPESNFHVVFHPMVLGSAEHAHAHISL